MPTRPSVVVYDACVLYPLHLKNILVQVGADRLVFPRWTLEIQNEWTRNLLNNDDSVSPEALAKTCRLMNTVVPNAMVTDYEGILGVLRAQHDAGMIEVDRKDLHVLAAAIKAQATIITTQNLKDFPADDLARFKIAAMTADDFLMDLHERNPAAFFASMNRAWMNLTRSSPAADVYVERLKETKLLPRVSDLLSANRDRLIDPATGDEDGDGGPPGAAND